MIGFLQSALLYAAIGYVGGVLFITAWKIALAKSKGKHLAPEDAAFESLAWPKYILFGVIWVVRKAYRKSTTPG